MKNTAKFALVLPLALSLMGSSAQAETGAHIEAATRALIMAVDLAEKAPLAQDMRASAVGLPEDFLKDRSYAAAFDGAEPVVLATANPAAAQMGMARNGGTAVTGAGFSSNVFLEILPDGTEAATGASGESLLAEQLAVAMRARAALPAADYALWMEKYARATATLSAARAEAFADFTRPVATPVVAMQRLEMTKVDRLIPVAMEAVAAGKLGVARGF